MEALSYKFYLSVISWLKPHINWQINAAQHTFIKINKP